jgi:hypothetical protein
MRDVRTIAWRLRRMAGRALGGGVARRTSLADPFAAFRTLNGQELVPAVMVEAAAAGTRAPELVVLIPSLELRRLTGGPNTVLTLGASVAARGISVRFVATHGPAAPSADLEHHIETVANRGSGLPIAFESMATTRRLRLAREDVVLATWWPTAHIAARAIAATGAAEFLYLVQDFEPAFYPWSTNYALALQTYSMPMRAIFNTSLLRDYVVASGIGRFATDPAAALSIAFEPAVDRHLFRARPRSGPRRLLFYARPSKPRNAFELGLAALREAVRLGAFPGDWEFWSIGDALPELPLGGGASLRPMPWQSLPAYGELLGGADILLSLMLSPHPSYPPLEMAAGGGWVVTNAFGVKTEAALAAISPSILAVKPEVAALASALADAAMRPRGMEAPVMELPATWAEALDPIADWIVSGRFGAPSPGS